MSRVEEEDSNSHFCKSHVPESPKLDKLRVTTMHLVAKSRKTIEERGDVSRCRG